MGSVLDKGNNKKKCQQFTSLDLVNKMLDMADYTTNLFGKKVLENSFGSGNVLRLIVSRYIKSAILSDICKENIASGLESDIYGIELDEDLYNKCIYELNDLVTSHGIRPVAWKLYNKNALSFKYDIKFDYIIGNPPYISYKDMDKDTREYLRKHFNSCSKGKFDYYYAFIDLGISLLSESGKLVQLVPNNIYKNVFANGLREMMIDHISSICDYPDQNLFEDALTSISIFLYDKKYNLDVINYENATTSYKYVIERSGLKEKWVFGSNNTNERMIRFGDVFNASIAIATLLNKAFVIDSSFSENEKIETDVLRKAVSPKSLRSKVEKQIIFPYKYVDNKLQHYSSVEFNSLFPNATNHLKNFEKELNNRDKDKGSKWFEYGRSQALSHLNQEKLLISSIITSRVEVYKLDADTIPYSGIYITVSDNKYSLDDAIQILKSNSFMDYIHNIGISINGKSLRITCKDINNFYFSGGK